MKKIAILFLSWIAAIMLVAAPQTKLATLSPTADKKLQPQVLHALTQDLSKRALPANQEVVRKAPQHRLTPIAKTAMETINLTGEGFLVGPEYDFAGMARLTPTAVPTSLRTSAGNIHGDGINRQTCSTRSISKISP